MAQSLPISTNVAVSITFSEGEWSEGFFVDLQIYRNGVPTFQNKYRVSSPPVSIPELYNNFGNAIEEQTTIFRAITKVPVQRTHRDVNEVLQELKTAKIELENALKIWLNEDSGFAHIKADIIGNDEVKKDSFVPVVFYFETNRGERNNEQDNLLRKVPWHLWDLFRRLDKAEPALGVPDNSSLSSLSDPVKILVALGSDEGGLELDEDIKSLENLAQKGAIVRVIPDRSEPSRKKLDTEVLHNLLWHGSWDIFVFTGHSKSTSNLDNGKIRISSDHDISIDTLEDDIRHATGNGLKLAIFNSCAGLGIANRLIENRAIPSVIVMRESVPDVVARKFIKCFFEEFSKGIPLDIAVRRARSHIRPIEDRKEYPFPSASWLPVVYRHPSQAELTWPKQTRPRAPWKWVGLVAGVVAAVGVIWNFTHSSNTDPEVSSGSSLESENISLGEDMLIDPSIWAGEEQDLVYRNCYKNAVLKDNGIKQFSEQEWGVAIESFEKYRAVCRVDPEALIYLNNAKAAQSGEPIMRIAVVVPIGSRDTVGPAQELLRGYAHAQQEINDKGGIDNRLVQIQIANDTSKSASLYGLTSDIAQSLSNDPSVAAVLGSFSSTATRTASDIYVQTRLVSVSPTSTAVRDTEYFPLNDQYTFRVAPTDARAAVELTSAIEDRGYTNIGIIYQSDDDYSKSLKNQSEAVLDSSIEIVIPDSCDLSPENSAFSPATCAAQLANVDAVLLFPSTEIRDDVQQIVLQINRLPQSPALFGGDAVFGDRTLEEVGSLVEGMLVSIPWHPSMDTGEASNFLGQAQDLWGIDRAGFNWRTALAYDAAQAIVGAVDRMSESSEQILSRTNVQNMADILKNHSFKGFLGEDTVDFDDAGDRTLNEQLNLGTLVEVKCANQEDIVSCYFDKPD